MNGRRLKLARHRIGTRRRAGFTAIEFMVLLGILIILASIFVPYALKLREQSRRVACRDDLRQLGNALRMYAAANAGFLPSTPHDPTLPLATFTGGSRDGDPFSGDGLVAPNDVTASLWLLVRGSYVTDTRVFLCPGSPRHTTPASPDRLKPNFPNPAALTYAYAAPFGATPDYRLTDTLKSGFVLMADAGPGGAAATVARTAPAVDFAVANSPLHRRAGQNVLYSEGTVLWMPTPYCGQNQDNIYTVRGDRGSTQPTSQPADDRGATDPQILPTAHDDTFLLPFFPSP